MVTELIRSSIAEHFGAFSRDFLSQLRTLTEKQQELLHQQRELLTQHQGVPFQPQVATKAHDRVSVTGVTWDVTVDEPLRKDDDIEQLKDVLRGYENSEARREMQCRKTMREKLVVFFVDEMDRGRFETLLDTFIGIVIALNAIIIGFDMQFNVESN